VLLGNTPREAAGFYVRGCHRLWPDFPDCLATPLLYHSPPFRQKRLGGPTTPRAQRLPAITRTRFSLIPVRSPLLGESRLLSLPAGTEMFHFPALPPTALCIQAGATPHDGCRVSPFGNPRITAWLPAPRGISQAPTSFLGSWCQGIHRVPLKTWHNKKHYIRREPPLPKETEIQVLDARVHCAVLKIRTAPAPAPPIRADRVPACYEDPGQKPVPSGPNSVPTQPGDPSARSATSGKKERTSRAISR
jgi:hypothetical protein